MKRGPGGESWRPGGKRKTNPLEIPVTEPASCIKQTRREHFQSLVMRVLLEVEWVMVKFTKSEVQQSRRSVVLDL